MPKLVTEFAMFVEQLVLKDKLTYLEAITHFGEERGIEAVALATLVKQSEPIRLKLEAECITNKCIGVRKGQTLDGFFASSNNSVEKQ